MKFSADFFFFVEIFGRAAVGRRTDDGRTAVRRPAGRPAGRRQRLERVERRRAPEARAGHAARAAEALPGWAGSLRFRLMVLYSVLLFGLATVVVGGIYAGLSAAWLRQVTYGSGRLGIYSYLLNRDKQQRAHGEPPRFSAETFMMGVAACQVFFLFTSIFVF